MSENFEPKLLRPKSAGNLHTFRSFTPTKELQTRPQSVVRDQLDTIQKIKDHPLIMQIDRPKTASSVGKRRPSSQSTLSQEINLRMNSARPSSAPFSTIINIHADVIEAVVNKSMTEKSFVKAAQKLETEVFHSTLFKMQKDKEDLEDKLWRLEAWQNSLKENDIWRNPKATLLRSILEHTGKMNPNGTVSEFLTIEQDRLDQKRSTKKLLRPSSSLGNIKGRRNENMEVKDFFKDDDSDDNNRLKRIIMNRKQPPMSIPSRDKDIRQTIDSYLSNMKNFQELVEQIKITGKYTAEEQEQEQEHSIHPEYKAQEESIQEVSKFNMVNTDIPDAISPKMAITNYNLHLESERINASSPSERSPITTNRTGTISRSGSATPGRVVVIHTRPLTSSRRSSNATQIMLPKENGVGNTFKTVFDPQDNIVQSSIHLSGSRAIMHSFKDKRTRSLIKLRPSTATFGDIVPERFAVNPESSTSENKVESIAITRKPQTLRIRKNSNASHYLRPMSSQENEIRRRLHTPRNEPYSFSTQKSVNHIHIDGNYLANYSTNPLPFPNKKTVIKSWVTNETNPLTTQNLDDELTK